MSHKVEATVDGIRFLYDSGEVEVDYNASNGDVVRLTIEPLEVKVTDGFRAAVKKACNCDSSSGGGSGGGMLAVHMNEVTGALDKTWQEIYDADFAVLKLPRGGNSGGNSREFANVTFVDEYEGEYAVNCVTAGLAEDESAENNLYTFVTDSPDGYPVRQGGGGFTPGTTT